GRWALLELRRRCEATRAPELRRLRPLPAVQGWPAAMATIRNNVRSVLLCQGEGERAPGGERSRRPRGAALSKQSAFARACDASQLVGASAWGRAPAGSRRSRPRAPRRRLWAN